MSEGLNQTDSTLTKPQTESPIDQELLAIGEALDRDAELVRTDSDEWLPNWYLGVLATLDTLEEKAKLGFKKLLRQIEAKRKALAYRYYADFRSQVERDLQGEKAKSKQYLLGRAGHRTSPGREKLEIVDEAKAIMAAEFAVKDGVKKTLNTKAVMAHYKETGEELPGTRVETTEPAEAFYPAPKGMKTLPTTPMLEGER